MTDLKGLLHVILSIGIKPDHDRDSNTRKFFLNIDILLGLVLVISFLLLARFSLVLPYTPPIYIVGLAFLPAGLFILWLNAMDMWRFAVFFSTLFTAVAFAYLAYYYGEESNFHYFLIIYGFTPFIYLGNKKKSALLISMVYVVSYSLLLLTDFQLFSATQVPPKDIEQIKNFNNWFLFLIGAQRFYMLYSMYLKSQGNLLQRHQDTQELLKNTQLLNKKLKDQETYLNEILESPKDLIIFSLDKNYRYKAFNLNHQKTMKAIWGVDIQVGQSMLDYIKLESDRAKAQKNFDRTLKGEEFTLEEEYGNDELQRSFYEDFYCPQKSPSGSIEGLTVFVKDVTERKLSQKAIKQKNKQLQKYIDSNLQLENFAYAASHDLREPLRTIISFSQLLGRQATEKLSPEEKDYLNFIITATKNLETLINDMLTYSRVDAQKHKLQQINLNPLLSTVLSSLHEAIKAKNALITIEQLPEFIVADASKMQQLFQNLLSNAIKFQQNEKQPKIVINGRSDTSHWHFSIIDNGIGIDPTFHEKIFLIFRKLHPKVVYEGSGIGLAICKKIVEQHEGEIGIESPNQHHGTTFHFSIRKNNLS